MQLRKKIVLIALQLTFMIMIVHQVNTQNAIVEANQLIVGDNQEMEVENKSTKGLYYNDQNGAFRVGAYGQDVGVVGTNSFSTGYRNQATALEAFAIGRLTVASGAYSFSSGGSTKASGTNSAAFNAGTLASGLASAAFGTRTRSTDDNSFATGFETEANGRFSFSAGIGTKANGYATAVFGRYNIGAGGEDIVIDDDPIFEVGNGPTSSQLNNAMTILTNGVFLLNGHVLPSVSATVSSNQMIFNPGNGAFRAGRLFNSSAWGTMGEGSFAVGYNSSATGQHSSAFNTVTRAEGPSSVAFGSGTKAVGSRSVSFGKNTEAIGINSFVGGENNITTARNSVVFGQYNVGGGNTIDWLTTDPLFELGNGSSSERSNAFTVLKNGTLIANGASLPALGTPTSGKQFFFDVVSGSFRVGELSNSSAWGSLGTNTFAVGRNTISSGLYSAAFGNGTQSTSGASASFGTNTIASNINATSFGQSTLANGENTVSAGLGTSSDAYNSMAIGSYNVGGGNTESFTALDPVFEVGNGTTSSSRRNAFTVLKNGSIIMNYHQIPSTTLSIQRIFASYNGQNGSFTGGRFSNSFDFSTVGNYSFAYGEDNSPSGLASASFGYQTKAGGRNAFSTGYQTTAAGDYASSFGIFSDAIGEHSVAMGEATIARAYGSIALGRWNRGYGNAATQVVTDPLLEVGVGTNGNRKNAMEIRNNGQTYLGDISAYQGQDLGAKFVVSTSSIEDAMQIVSAGNRVLIVDDQGTTSLGGAAPTTVAPRDVYVHQKMGIGKAPSKELDIDGSASISANSGGSLSQLTLHETADDFARMDFTNTNTETKWTIAAKPESVLANSRFNLFLEGAGNILVVKGDNKLGIGRTPSHPLHVGDDPLTGNGAHVTAGGTWTNGSSRTFKENFQKVNNASILATLMGLDILKWEYKGSNEGQHMGPIAEEFHKAFGLGTDEKYISTVDIDGVALASIQALAQQNELLGSKLDQVEKENAELRNRLARIERILSEMHK